MRAIKYFAILIMMGAWCYGQAPTNWVVNPPDYESNMTVTALLYINGVESAGTDLTVAAFAGSECRGVAQPIVTNGHAMYFLLIYGNNTSASIVLKVYCPTPDTVLIISETLNYESNLALGQPDDPFIFHSILTVGIDAGLAGEPVGFQLHPNYPNPFNATTFFNYELQKPEPVRFSVFDLSGQLIITLVNAIQPACSYQIAWNSQNQPSGTYLYRLETPTYSTTRKCLLIK